MNNSITYIKRQKEEYKKKIDSEDQEWPTDVKILYSKLNEVIFESGVKVNNIIKDIGYKNNNIMTKFRHYVGQTPKKWLIRHRIRLAKELLKKQSVSVTEAAFAVGYDNPSSFSKIF